MRISPAVRLSLGLVLLTLSMLMAAQFIGITPSGEHQQLKLRQQLAENLALQSGNAMEAGDSELLKSSFKKILTHHSEVLSAGLRGADGDLLFASPNHSRYWASAKPGASTPTHVRLPIYTNGVQRALLEVSFKPLTETGDRFFGLPSFVALSLFIATSGFVGYWLFIRRALKHLDPSSVVPARVRNALNILSEGVLILDKRQQIVLANNTLLDKLNSTEKKLLGRKVNDLPWQMDQTSTEVDLPWDISLNTGQTRRGVRVALQQADEDELVFRVNSVPIQDDGGNRQGTIVSFDDISELEEKNRLLEDMMVRIGHIQADLESKNRELSYQASHDPMTGCHNRRALFDYLDNKFESAQKMPEQFCCIMTDIDHFKKVNDTYGHAAGDAIIKMVAKNIQETLRDGDIVARYGGEEFCIILPRTTVEQAETVAQRCRQKIGATECEGIMVTSSFGVATLASGAKDPQDLINKADEALYASKRAGRNCVTLWTPEMDGLSE